MNRRSFVKTTAMATAALAATDSFAFGSRKRKIGIQLYTVRDEMKSGIDSVIAKLASVGYEEVELYGYFNGKYFGKTSKEMADLLKQHNLTSPSAHIGLNDFLYKGNDDVWKKAIEDAKIIGNKYMVIPWIEPAYRKSLDDYKKIIARLNRAAELTTASGLKFAYHNHAFEFEKFGDTSGYDLILNETDKNMVKLELDLYWVYNAGKDPFELFSKHPGRFVMWHVKDMDKNDKNKQTEVGNGSIDFKAIFKKAKQSGLEYFFVEQENYDVSPYDSIEKSIKFVKANLV
jgi:sugar phosphate isomerase/epimerase